MENKVPNKKEENIETDMEAINTEQDEVVRKLREALDFFENVKIKNKTSLDRIKGPLDDLLSSLKYVPVENGACFDDLPVEIKTEILNDSCDKGAFVAAAVCKEWKSILEKRLIDVDSISIGKCCYRDDEPNYTIDCENFLPEEILKASVVLGMDIPLEICYPLTNIDSQLIIDGLMSISDFKIFDGCFCRNDEKGRKIVHGPLLGRRQTRELFEAIENKTDLNLNTIDIRGLDMIHLDQEKLIDCLFKIKNVTLAEGCESDWVEGNEPDTILDFEEFVMKLLDASESADLPDFQLSNLHLEYMSYPESLSEDLANALCNVEMVQLGEYFPLSDATLKQIIRNVLEGGAGVAISSLLVVCNFDWSSIITSEDLRMLVTNLKHFLGWGKFSQEQVNAVKSLDGVDQACEGKISKR